MDWTALWVSVRLSVAATAVLLAIGVPIAYWVAFSTWRWKFLVEAIVALSLAKRVAGRSFLIPAEMHPAIEQGGAVLKGALHADAARTFRAFMMSSEGRAVLARYGLSPPEG